MSELDCKLESCENRESPCSGCPSGDDRCIHCYFFLASNFVVGYCYKHERRILVASWTYSCLQYQDYKFSQEEEKIRKKFIKGKHMAEFPKDFYNPHFNEWDGIKK